MYVRQFDVAGTTAAKARIVGYREARRRCRDQKQADPPRWSLMIMNLRGDDDLVGGRAGEHGKLLPHRRAEAERIIRHLAAMIGIVAFGHEALGAFAQQPLLVTEIEVHRVYSAAAGGLRTEGCRPDGSTIIPNSWRLWA